ncbi:MAG: hypothetical protein HC895_21400 [Leptolyngbyaceae cyanobacterium SM1_3_5]|nr:hypothetical protein [Leptolyngbyaceae cyanobacterium SM1_3_5]
MALDCSKCDGGMARSTEASVALLRRHGAIDFATGELLSDVGAFGDSIDSHHIFPIAYCRSQGIEIEKYNCLVNRTPLSASTNRVIGGKAPSVYLTKLEEQGISRRRLNTILRSHLIEPDFLWRDDFEGFFRARMQALTQLVNQAIGSNESVSLELRNCK